MQFKAPQSMQMDNPWLNLHDNILKRLAVCKMPHAIDPRLVTIFDCQKPSLDTRRIKSSDKPLH